MTGSRIKPAPVIPADAGIHEVSERLWIPAFAGMTRVHFFAFFAAVFLALPLAASS